MLAVGLTRVSRGEDACQTTVLRDERAADVMRGHVFENGIEPGTAVDGIGLRHEDIADEELIERRQADLGIKRPFHIPVREDAAWRTLSPRSTENGKGVITDATAGMWSMQSADPNPMPSAAC